MTPLGEGSERRVILEQWLRSREGYLFPVSKYPITNQTMTKVDVQDENTYQIFISSQHPDEEFQGPLQPVQIRQSFTIVTSPSGFIVVPNMDWGVSFGSDVASPGVLQWEEAPPSFTIKSLVEGLLRIGRIVFRKENQRETAAADETVFQRESSEEKFRNLAARWKNERDLTASIAEIVIHPAYQQIIGMGQEAIPMLLRELEREPDHWFWALRAITGQDPVPQGNRGKIKEMTLAWLQWGRQRGYI
jgi:hypothetical protein